MVKDVHLLHFAGRDILLEELLDFGIVPVANGVVVGEEFLLGGRVGDDLEAGVVGGEVGFLAADGRHVAGDGHFGEGLARPVDLAQGLEG